MGNHQSSNSSTNNVSDNSISNSDNSIDNSFTNSNAIIGQNNGSDNSISHSDNSISTSRRQNKLNDNYQPNSDSEDDDDDDIFPAAVPPVKTSSVIDSDDEVNDLVDDCPELAGDASEDEDDDEFTGKEFAEPSANSDQDDTDEDDPLLMYTQHDSNISSTYTNCFIATQIDLDCEDIFSSKDKHYIHEVLTASNNIEAILKHDMTRLLFL